MRSEPQGNALVVGDNDLAGLATVRSLGRAGLDVHLVAFEKSAITRWSRHVRKVHRLGHPLEDPGKFVNRFLDLLRTTRYDLVVPTTDKVLVPLMERREEIDQHTCFAAPDRPAFYTAYRKEETIALAERLGVPVPRGKLVLDPAELVRPYRFPLVLKPVSSVTTSSLERNEVRVVRSEEELRYRLPRLLRRCPVLVQEFCPGHGVGLAVLADRGELVAAFQHQRVHEPPEGGASSYRKSVPLSPELLGWASEIVRGLRWTGPAMVEFKVDPATGRAVLMEINGRLWGSLSLAIQAGVDFPRLMYDLLVLGRATPTFSYRSPFFVRHSVRDVWWLRSNFRAPKGRTDLLRKGIAEVAAEVGNVVRFREGYDLESLTDPLPALTGWVEFTREIWSGCRQKLTRRWYGWLARRRAAQVHRRVPAVLDRIGRARSVLFVCLGNINRSAVAEQVLRELCPQLEVMSAGLLPRPGRPTGQLSFEVAADLGVNLASHRSTPLTAEQLRSADLVLIMEGTHLQGVRSIDRGALDKTFLLSAFHSSSVPGNISDPEGGDRAVFHHVYQTVVDSVRGLARLLKSYSAGPKPCSPLARKDLAALPGRS